MNELISSIEKLKSRPIGKQIRDRMAEFRSKGKQGENEIFKELCFCILTANYSAEGGMRVQEAVGNRFITLPEAALAKQLKSLGYRFPNIRAKYVVSARNYKSDLCVLLASNPAPNLDQNSNPGQKTLREWIVKHIHGLGYKEASHFLRNIGYGSLAIIDFHILELLERNNLIKKQSAHSHSTSSSSQSVSKSRSVSKRRYLEIEQLLSKIAIKTKMSLGELDLYLWYVETGKVLK